MIRNAKVKNALVVILLIVLLAVLAVYYFGEESIPGAPLPDETTNIVPSSMKHAE